MRWRIRHRRERHSDAPAPALRSSDPAARGARSRRAGAGHDDRQRLERAAARFNASEAGGTVRGLVRTLGDPWVSVGAAAGTADEVRVTVAWSLSWYQWGVDLSDEARSVYELRKGGELYELDPAARQWNASTAKDGEVVVAGPDRRMDRDATRR